MPRLDAERIALWRAFTRTSTEITRRIENELNEEFELPIGWFEVMSALQRNDGAMRVSALCAELGELPSSLSRRLDRMEDEGHVLREATPQPDDRRAVTVKLTREGRALWRDANVAFRRGVQRHFAQVVTDTDLAALQRLLAKLAP
jgi:DNA-binding MarR family transcriptional regulator